MSRLHMNREAVHLSKRTLLCTFLTKANKPNNRNLRFRVVAGSVYSTLARKAQNPDNPSAIKTRQLRKMLLHINSQAARLQRAVDYGGRHNDLPG